MPSDGSLTAQLTELLYRADLLEAQLQLEATESLLNQALQTDPTQPQLWARRAELHKNSGNLQAALADLQQALVLSDPSVELAYQRLQSRQLLLQWSQAPNWQQQAQLLQTWAQSLPAHSAFYSPQRPAADKSLRIGYLSPDFRWCSAAMLLEQLFLHQPAHHHYFAYDLVNSQDPAHQTFAAHFGKGWRKLAGLSAAQAAEVIAADQLDLLIDLAGHTSLSGLAILGHRPAPWQVCGLTFNGPTAHPAVDAQFTDPTCWPQPTAAFEPPIYLPTWISWPQPMFKLKRRQAAELPRQGYRLGCAHHPGRISPQSVACWAEILKQAPQAQLHLKHRFYASQTCRQQMTQRFAEQGVAAERLHFSGESPYPDYFAFYQQVDLVLDPFPYHGGLVSCEALWAGLPLITEASWMRGGASLLQQVGFTAGIAQGEQAYISQALEILNSLPLRQMALQAPERFRKSPAMQPPQWTQAIFHSLQP